MEHSPSAVVPEMSARASMATSSKMSSNFSARQSFKIVPSSTERSLEDLLPPEPDCKSRFQERCRLISDNFRFNVLTTVLTVYALFGDDFRLLATLKYLDTMFDVFTIICILVFILEIIVASFGKADYFLSFFFALDAVSTATLVLDLTWVGSSLFCGDAEGGAVRSSRAGRAGARAGRTVRIIRLMRLVKLYVKYKASLEEKEKEKAKQKERSSRNSVRVSGPGEDEEDEPELVRKDSVDMMLQKQDEAKAQPQEETRVGKKLGDMTTRRVIILVLVMLFCLPQFIPSSHGNEDFLTSMDIAMDFIYERFRQYCPMNTSAPWCLQPDAVLEKSPTTKNATNRALLEDFLLELIYSHQGGDFAYSLYWLGLQSKSKTSDHESQGKSTADAKKSVGELLGEVFYLAQKRYLGTQGVPVADWDRNYANPDWNVKLQPLSSRARAKLTTPWTENCYGTFWGAPLGEILSPINSDENRKCSIDEDLRCSEVSYMAPQSKSGMEESNLNMIFVFNTRASTTMEAGLNMLQTIFICFCVGIGAMTFSNDANQLLLQPIERMIAKMETIKDNPLEAMKLGDMEYRREEIENAKRKEELADMSRFKRTMTVLSSRKTKEPMETVILEKTIIKLGSLLALGFGEAGAEIIGHNMTAGHSAGVNAMLPGNRVEAIFGFCTIHNFLVVNQVLKEKVMIFVNQIGEIVHGCVDEFNGAANKNIGDSFLLIWRISGYDPRGQSKLADMAIMSFVRIVTEVNKSPVLAQYRVHPGIAQRCRKFRVTMGFGLHCGWAIEGAIGSDFKIDASYLSPNVNVAALLDAAAGDLGVWLLMSHFMMSLCSKELAMLCRLIDHVMVKSARQPIRLFTIDLDYMNLAVTNKPPGKYIKNRFKIRQIREVWKQDKWAETYNVWDAFEHDEDLLLMRHCYTAEFFRRFATAYRNYETGNWRVARDLFFTCHYAPRRHVGNKPWVPKDEWPPDGPTQTLLAFMQKSDFKAPAEWPGYRELRPGDKLF